MNNSSLTPDQRVLEALKTLEQARKSGADYWRLYAHLCLKDLWFFIRVALGWDWLDSKLHGEILIPFYEENKGCDTAVFIPRGHGKTLVAAARIMREMLANPNVAIMFASATEDLANSLGSMIAQNLIGNDNIQRAFKGIVPTSTQDTDRWGKDGYALPNRKPRTDATLFCSSLKGNVTGKHPEIIFLDDTVVRTNNTPQGWAMTESFLRECMMLLPPQGVIHVTGTRWHDGDPYGKILAGRIHGKQGPFRTMVLSCWEDDNPLKAPTYPRAKRWGKSHFTGYSNEQLDAMRKPESEGGLGIYFDAQMRNDPIPVERQDLRISDVNTFSDDEAPELGELRLFGLETTAGGKPIYSLLQDQADKLRLSIPIQPIEVKRQRGSTKLDRIRASLEPVMREGRLFVKSWMLGDSSSSDGLGYEIRRFGAAKHDDVVDALHMAIDYLAGQARPSKGSPADVYIACDLSFSEERRSDWTVAMAVAVTAEGNFYLLDYDRFQTSSASGLVGRLIEFFQKWNRVGKNRRNAAKSYSIALSYK